jgi:hypothetical protein
MRTEIRHAVRSLLRDRVFALMIVLSLAVGIGANTAIFSLVNGVLLQPPDFPHPERLVALTQWAPKLLKSYPAQPVNIAIYREWRKQLTSFESIGIARANAFNLTGSGQPEQVRGANVSSAIFHVLGVPPRLGRAFTEQEDQSRQDQVVILADSLWRRRYQADPRHCGPQDSARWQALRSRRRPAGFVPFPARREGRHVLPARAGPSRAAAGASLLVRTSMDPRSIANALRGAVWRIDGEVTVPEMRTLSEVLSRSVAQRRFQMLLVLLFALAALALAAFGTYGVLSYAVTRRTPEMGIRMALGAQRRDVLAIVLRQGMMPVLVGMGAGALSAVAIGRYLESLLFHVSPRDPLAFGVSGAVLLAVSVTACLVPARRATRVSPIEALRFE